ncbi:uncharacterized protein EV154DRAFT_503418 [Mucor mucedo]|uniref:uncharacterized protein n=1 Tax=Mucor mucedo TaxID=29922 RepID=UPI0022206211|nr:uncharacterized protein EV154DRAFT_503418 [Mucor mucedo]KAI7892943.1 hypothetical protein EV154DRAFT_503418 [Mucor mucedo]
MRKTYGYFTKSPDLCIAEYAKEATPAKYFYDKTKIVIATLVHLKEHISRGKLTLDQAKLFVVPFVLCEGLEAEIHCLRLVSDDWCIVEKVKDFDLPCSVEEIKNGKIAEYVYHLRTLKVLHISVSYMES